MWRHGLFVENVVQNCGDVLAAKRLLARGHFVQHHTEGKNICAAIHGFALDLLWRHVAGSAHGGGLLRGAVLHDLGGAEISNLHKIVAGQHDVGRLDIAMHDAVVVREL